jgi:hypothetical protein
MDSSIFLREISLELEKTWFPVPATCETTDRSASVNDAVIGDEDQERIPSNGRTN